MDADVLSSLQLHNSVLARMRADRTREPHVGQNAVSLC
jgi:hypothetical protein